MLCERERERERKGDGYVYMPEAWWWQGREAAGLCLSAVLRVHTHRTHTYIAKSIQGFDVAFLARDQFLQGLRALIGLGMHGGGMVRDYILPAVCRHTMHPPTHPTPLTLRKAMSVAIVVSVGGGFMCGWGVSDMVLPFPSHGVWVWVGELVWLRPSRTSCGSARPGQLRKQVPGPFAWEEEPSTHNPSAERRRGQTTMGERHEDKRETERERDDCPYTPLTHMGERKGRNSR